MYVFRNDQIPFILMVVLTLAAIILFWSVMGMVLLGASLAIVLLPVHHYLTHRIRRIFSAILITAVVICACGVFTWCTLVILSSNATTLSGIFSTIGTWLGSASTQPEVFGFPLKAGLISLLNTGNTIFLNYRATLIDDLSYIAFNAFIFFFTLFILLLHGEELKKKIVDRLPAAASQYVHRLSSVTADTLYAIYVVQIAIAVLTFFISLPVFYLLGYGNVIFYSFLAALCELVPVMGASVAFLLIGAYALAIGDIRGVLILFFLGYIAVSCMPEIFIRPVLVGRRVHIHPVLMFIGIIGGLLTMKLAGFVLGPIIVVLVITSYRMYVKDRKYQTEITTNGA
jgi:predicted PurR-regulated permease PerM